MDFIVRRRVDRGKTDLWNGETESSGMTEKEMRSAHWERGRPARLKRQLRPGRPRSKPLCRLLDS
jgi:hypothetical protein